MMINNRTKKFIKASLGMWPMGQTTNFFYFLFFIFNYYYLIIMREEIWSLRVCLFGGKIEWMKNFTKKKIEMKTCFRVLLDRKERKQLVAFVYFLPESSKKFSPYNGEKTGRKKLKKCPSCWTSPSTYWLYLFIFFAL